MSAGLSGRSFLGRASSGGATSCVNMGTLQCKVNPVTCLSWICCPSDYRLNRHLHIEMRAVNGPWAPDASHLCSHGTYSSLLTLTLFQLGLPSYYFHSCPLSLLHAPHSSGGFPTYRKYLSW